MEKGEYMMKKVLSFIIILCIIMACFLIYENNNLIDSDFNSTVATEVNSSPEPVESSEDYDPYGYGNDIYHYDAATDTYLRDDSSDHYIYEGRSWVNVDMPQQFSGSTQSEVIEFRKEVGDL